MNPRFLVVTSIAAALLCALPACATRSSRTTTSGGTYADGNDVSSSTIEVYRSENNLVTSTGTSQPYDGTVVERTTITTKETRTVETGANRDGEILALLVAIDEHESRAGAEALKKELRAEVRDFAKMMQDEHARHADETRSLARNLGITLNDTDAVTEQRTKDDRSLSSISSLEGEAFDRAFVDALVKGHDEVLAKLDGFLATAQKEEVRSHVQKTRDAVAKHRDEALKLQTGTR